MAALTSFYPDLLLDFPGVPSPILESAARRGCIQAAVHSGAVRATINLDLVPGTRSYALALPGDTDHAVATVLSVMTDYRPLAPMIDDPVLIGGNATGRPATYLFSEQVLYLYPIPDTAQTAAVRVAIKPAGGALTVRDRFVDDPHLYEAAIAWGKRWLCLQAARPWARPDLAPFYEAEFVRNADLAKLRGLRGDTGADMSVRPRVFGRP